MSRLVPADLRRHMIAAISADADAAGWEHLPQADKTRLLGRWVTDPDIGGVLRPLLGSDAEVRVWITDVALKRRARSLLPSASQVALATMGAGATITAGSEGIKPPHCVVESNGDFIYICWDRARNFRNLLWAALCAREDLNGLDGVMVAVIEPNTIATEPSARQRLARIAAECDIGIRWVESL